MMQFSRNEDICLAHKALPLWVSLLSSAERAQRGQQGQFTLPMECAAALMDLAGGAFPPCRIMFNAPWLLCTVPTLLVL